MNMISEEIIADFFVDLEENNEFNLSGKLLWGFFFVDSSKEKLSLLGNKLVRDGFIFVDIFEAEKENGDDTDEYYLHIEKVEHHDISSLKKRNDLFYSLAKEYGITNYDGFDVGKVE